MINVEKKIAGKTLTIQTGKIARQAAGSVVLTYGDTTLLVAVNASKEAREDINDFLKEKLDLLKARFLLAV